jgi:hypothetical protein
VQPSAWRNWIPAFAGIDESRSDFAHVTLDGPNLPEPVHPCVMRRMIGHIEPVAATARRIGSMVEDV